jgi:flagellar biosynthesis/type III secretory pathway protein FliH
MIIKLMLVTFLALLLFLLVAGCSQPTQNQADIQNSYNQGYTQGQAAGYQDGYAAGAKAGIAEGYSKGYQEGLNSGYQSGLKAGIDTILSVWPANVPKPVINQAK